LSPVKLTLCVSRLISTSAPGSASSSALRTVPTQWLQVMSLTMKVVLSVMSEPFSGEVIEYGAIGAVVALAAVSEMPEGFHHALKLRDLGFERCNVRARYLLHFGAGAGLVLPER